MYSIDTIGSLLGRAPCRPFSDHALASDMQCRLCARKGASAISGIDVPNLNPFDDDFWAYKLGATIRQRAADALEEAKKLPNIIPPMPKIPDPVAPSVDAFGPSGWGGYVVPSLVIAAAATVGVVLYRRRHGRSR